MCQNLFNILLFLLSIKCVPVIGSVSRIENEKSEKSINKKSLNKRGGARFSKLKRAMGTRMVITGPVIFFFFSLQMGVLKVLKIIQERYQLKKQYGLH